MTDRNTTTGQGKANPAVAALLAAAVAVLAAVRWLASLDWLRLAGIAAAVAVLLFGWWALWPRRRLPRNRVRYMRLRLRLRLYPGAGHATLFELWLRWGRGAAARRARRARPSLPWWARWLFPSQTSVLVGRAQYQRGLRVPTEEHVIFISPPRKGKSGALAEIIEQYPGPVVVTTTREDLYRLTARSRAARGPVHVWNPQQLASVASTMRWDLLGGCEDPGTAIRRAVPLSAVASYKGEGEDFWAAAIELWLQTLLHVAAMRRASMDLVHYWALSRSPDSFLGALEGAGGEAERWGTLIRDLMGSAATRTTDTIRYMAAANLGFMLNPVLREAVTPGPGLFSPADFVRDGGTLYLIAESRDERPAPVAGLFAALVTEIYYEAARAAAGMRGGRLDPPMLWALDEVTQTCPLPLPSMLADAGGRGIQIMPVVHGAAQLRMRWGRDGTRAILDTTSVKVFLPGISDPETLELGSKLSDTMPARERGDERDSRHPVMTEAMISRLPARRDGTGYAFILRDGLTPVIARPPVIWHGSWYKNLTRRSRRRYQPPPARPHVPASPAGPPAGDSAPQPLAALPPAPDPPAGHAWHSGDSDDSVGRPAAAAGQPGPHGTGRAWHGTGGAS